MNQSISASAPVDLSSFDFTQKFGAQALFDLSSLLSPLPTYKNPEKRAEVEERIKIAARELAALSWLRDRGLVHIARLMAYFYDPSSPCQWREHVQGAPPRLWNLTKPGVAWKMSQEMEAENWWPAGLAPLTPGATDPPAEEQLAEIDLAALSGVEESKRVGMKALDCQALEEEIAPLLQEHGCFLQRRRLGGRIGTHRGYALELWYAEGRFVRFYSPGQWDLVLLAWTEIGLLSPDLIDFLSAALRAEQVA